VDWWIGGLVDWSICLPHSSTMKAIVRLFSVDQSTLQALQSGSARWKSSAHPLDFLPNDWAYFSQLFFGSSSLSFYALHFNFHHAIDACPTRIMSRQHMDLPARR